MAQIYNNEFWVREFHYRSASSTYILLFGSREKRKFSSLQCRWSFTIKWFICLILVNAVTDRHANKSNHTDFISFSHEIELLLLSNDIFIEYV